MKVKILLGVMFLFILPFISAANDTRIIDELEQVLQQRSFYIQKKENQIDSLKNLLYPSMSMEERFRLYNDIYEAYYTYRFDSAMQYVDREENIAMQLSNSSNLNRSIIHRSMLLSTSGYFSESVQNLQQIDSRTLDDTLRFMYLTAYEWAYSMWAEYSDDKVYAPHYYEKEMLYQDSLVSMLSPDSPFHHYWKAENQYRRHQYDAAEASYKKALENIPINIRLYAQVTYGLALVYEKRGDWEQYEHYLIRAAISDQVCPLKENLALQTLAQFIFKNKKGEVERANRYLNYAMEDAMFYNNRLRLLQLAKKFPDIVFSYQEQNRIKNQHLQWAVIVISLLAVGLVVSIFYIYRQVRQLRKRRQALAEMNKELHQLNNELRHLNQALVSTNHTREEYVSLFMDLCAAYIDKLNRYQDLVRRKVKARQTDDLLKLVNATRLSDTDAKEFFVNFDTAFLRLYPDFITSFNALLRDEERIVLKRGEILNTELRIFALIRMGIKDSAKIATLLFYSPQTIYNYRSTVKGKAKDKEIFEKQVEELCAVLS